MKEQIASQPRRKKDPDSESGKPLPRAREMGINGHRNNVVTALSGGNSGVELVQHDELAEMTADIESARAFLEENLSPADWGQVEEVCAQNPRVYLIFRDLVESRNPTTFNTLLKASPVYRDSEEMFVVFEDFARSGIDPEGSDEEIKEARARATNSIIFLAQTESFYDGNLKIFNLLVEIARKIDVTEFLQNLYKAQGNRWAVFLVCTQASHKANMPEAELIFQRWFNQNSGTKKTPLHR